MPKKFTRCLLLSRSVQKERRFSAGHSVKLNSFPLQANLCASSPSAHSLLPLAEMWKGFKHSKIWHPDAKAELFIFSLFNTGISSGVVIKTEIQGMLHCGLSFILTQLDAFQGWWASGLWAAPNSSDSHTEVKGHLCWMRCYFQGDRHIYTLAQPILFWISYKYSSAISLSSENLLFFPFFFSFYFLPIWCKLFLIFVSGNWKKKNNLSHRRKIKRSYNFIFCLRTSRQVCSF